MNLIPLAALLIAALAFATSVTAIVLVERLRRARPVRQRQSAGAHSVQILSGGITISDAVDAEGTARRVNVQMGRHL